MVKAVIVIDLREIRVFIARLSLNIIKASQRRVGLSLMHNSITNGVVAILVAAVGGWILTEAMAHTAWRHRVIQ